MHAEVQALLALQAEDEMVDALSKRREAVERRLLDLERQRQVAADALARAVAAVESEEQRLRELETRMGGHRQLHDRNVAQLDAVRRVREANAATTQAEITRRVLDDDESQRSDIAHRLGDLRQAVAAQEGALADVASEQEATRAELEQERTAIDEALGTARAQREATARDVPRSLLTRYERIHARRGGDAVFPLRGPSCANCDTAVPLQRRHEMLATGAVEVCETCGVLLYATN